MTQSTRTALKTYGVALLSVAVCALLAELFRPMLVTTPTMLFTLAILISAWYGGLGPGLVATGLGLLAINFFLLWPIHSFHIDHWLYWPRLGLFCFAGLATSWLMEVLYKTRQDYQLKKQELWMLQARYERIIETAREGIWIVDPDARTSYISNRMLHMLGYTVPEIGNRRLWDFLEPESASEAQRLWQERWLGVQEEHDFCFARKDGSEFWASVATNTLYDSNAQFAGVVCMITGQHPLPPAEEFTSDHELPLVS
jgi:PAS domain S-box-containing protein